MLDTNYFKMRLENLSDSIESHTHKTLITELSALLLSAGHSAETKIEIIVKNEHRLK